MVIPIFVCWSPEVCCYGNQLNLGDVCRHRQKRPLIVALTFDNGYNYRQTAFKILNVNNLATLCTNVVSIGPIISEFTLLKRSIFAAIRPQFDDRFPFVTLAFRSGLEYRNSDFNIVIGNHLSTSDRNLARFGSVTRSLTLMLQLGGGVFYPPDALFILLL